MSNLQKSTKLPVRRNFRAENKKSFSGGFCGRKKIKKVLGFANK